VCFLLFVVLYKITLVIISNICEWQFTDVVIDR